jgi:hypothetical protein
VHCHRNSVTVIPEAHHNLPQKFEADFSRRGLDIHIPFLDLGGIAALMAGIQGHSMTHGVTSSELILEQLRLKRWLLVVALRPGTD